MTPKEDNFCLSYARNQNAIQACREAGYSEMYAKGNAHKILKRPHIIAEIKRLRERLNQQAEKSATDVVNEFSKIAFADRVDFLKEDPHYPDEFIYKTPDELTPDQRAIVEKVTYNMHEITVIENGEVQKLWIKSYTYVLSDKSKALENMGRHFGIFDDKIRLTTGKMNPFADATPEQLSKLKESFIKTMGPPQKAIEGDYVEVKKNGS